MAYKRQTRRKQTRKQHRKGRKQTRKQQRQMQRGSGFFNKVKGAFTKKSKVVPYVSSNITNVPAYVPTVNAPVPNIPNEPKKPSKPIKLVILTVKLELLDRSNNMNNNNNGNVSTDELIEWYEDHGFDVIEFYEYTEPVIEHIKNDLYQIAFVPRPEESEEDIEFNAEMIADVDDDGNYPIEKGKKRYLVYGEVKNVEFDYE